MGIDQNQVYEPPVEVARSDEASSSSVSETETVLRKRFLDKKERYDMYNCDFEIFRILFNELTPWGKCQHIDLAEKLFRLMDKREVGYLDFEQLVLALGLILCGKSVDKLKLLYILHLPPLLLRSEIDLRFQQQRKTIKVDGGDMEMAAEAELFFSDDTITTDALLDALPSPSELLQLAQPSFPAHQSQSTFYVDLPMQNQCESIDTVSDISDLGLRTHDSSNLDDFSHISSQSDHPLGSSLANKASPSVSENRSLNSLRYYFDQSTDFDGPANTSTSTIKVKTIPSITQMHFITLWTTMLEIMGRLDDDVQESYENLIRVGYQHKTKRHLQLLDREFELAGQSNSGKKQEGLSVESLTQMVLNEDLVSNSSSSNAADNNGNPVRGEQNISEDTLNKIIDLELDKMDKESEHTVVSAQWQISFDDFSVWMPPSINTELSKKLSIKDGIAKMKKRKCIP